MERLLIIFAIVFMSSINYCLAELIPIINPSLNGYIWIEIPEGYNNVQSTPLDKDNIYEVYNKDDNLLIYEYNSDFGAKKLANASYQLLRSDSIVDKTDVIKRSVYTNGPDFAYSLEKTIENKPFRMYYISSSGKLDSETLSMFKKCARHGSLYAMWEMIIKDTLYGLIIFILFGMGGAKVWDNDFPTYCYVFLPIGIIFLIYLYTTTGWSTSYIITLVAAISAFFLPKFKFAEWIHEIVG